MFLENVILNGSVEGPGEGPCPPSQVRLALAWARCNVALLGTWWGEYPNPVVYGEGGLAWTPGWRTQAALICPMTLGLFDRSPFWETVKWMNGLSRSPRVSSACDKGPAHWLPADNSDALHIGQSDTEHLLCTGV